MTYNEFNSNCDAMLARIAAACERTSRPAESVALLPVTKTHPAECVEYVYRRGLPAVGENRVQEALEKSCSVTVPIQWELIGHLQSNKVKQAVGAFSRIQSVDSIKLVRRIAHCAAEAGIRQRILLQVNAGDDPAKFGIACADAPQLLEAALGEPSLAVEGWMTIAPFVSDERVVRTCFARLRQLRVDMNEAFGLSLAELSMGMSDDLEWAIAEGSTLVRVGSALFGRREEV